MKKLLQKILPYTKYLLLLYLFCFGCPMLYIESIDLSIHKIAVAIIIVLMFAAAHTLVYTNRYLRKSLWKGSIVSAVILEMFGLLLFAQKHLLWSVILLLASAAAYFGLIAYLLKANPRNAESEKFIKRCMAFSRAGALLVLMVIVAVPSIIGSVNETVLFETEEDWNAFAEDYLAKNSITEEKDVLSESEEMLQKLSSWDTLTFEEKQEVLCEVAVVEMKTVGISDSSAIDFGFEKMETSTLGYYSDSEKIIRINICHLNDRTMEETIRTVLHEVYHAYEFYVVGSLDFDSQVVSAGLYFKQAREWKENIDDYIPSIIDFDAYQTQPLERDANQYAEERFEQYAIALEELNA